MRFHIFATIAFLSFGSLGCDRPPANKIDVEKSSVKIEAPGVKVDVNETGGVEVEAPGVHVDTAPANSSDVKVDVERAK